MIQVISDKIRRLILQVSLGCLLRVLIHINHTKETPTISSEDDQSCYVLKNIPLGNWLGIRIDAFAKRLNVLFAR